VDVTSTCKAEIKIFFIFYSFLFLQFFGISFLFLFFPLKFCPEEVFADTVSKSQSGLIFWTLLFFQFFVNLFFLSSLSENTEKFCAMGSARAPAA